MSKTSRASNFSGKILTWKYVQRNGILIFIQEKQSTIIVRACQREASVPIQKHHWIIQNSKLHEEALLRGEIQRHKIYTYCKDFYEMVVPLRKQQLIYHEIFFSNCAKSGKIKHTIRPLCGTLVPGTLPLYFSSDPVTSVWHNAMKF